MADDFDSLWGTSGAAATPSDSSGTTVLDPKDFEKTWLTDKTSKTDTSASKPVVVTQPGILANAEHDDTWAPLKNIATGAIKGAGDIVGAVGNTANLADYLIARGQSAITGKPLAEVQADLAQRKATTNALRSQTALGTAANALAPQNVLPSGPDVYNPILNKTGAFVPTTEGQKLAQSGVETVVGGLGPGVRGAPLNAAAAPVNALASGIVRQAPALAATGALGQGVTDATGDPLLGLAATAAIPTALRAGGAAVNRVVGTVDPNTATLAQTARNQFNIPVGAGEISSNPTVRFMNSVVNKLPGSGGVAHREDMQTSFNQAVSNTFGEDAPRITPQVMAQARDRIGNVFEGVAQRTPVIHADPQLAGELRQTIHNAQATMTPEEVTPLIHQVQNIASLVDPQTNTLTGEIYQNLTRRGTPLDRAMQSANPNIRAGARDIREALDGAMERSAPPDVVDDLRQARGQWRNLRTIEPLVAKAPTGDISPALLQGRVNTNFKGTYGSAYGGGGDLKTLSDIGQRFMKEPPSSGTAERGMLMHLLGGAGAGGMGIATGELPLHTAALAAAGTLGSAALGRGVAAGLRSNTLTNSLINRSLGNANQGAFTNYLLSSTLPATVNPRGVLGP
jgi:hypothetical protein